LQKINCIGIINRPFKLYTPEILITHFDLVTHTTVDSALHLHFEEKKGTPKEKKHRILIAHGFHKEIVIKTFLCEESLFIFT
jgi:hypothetical protein